MENASKALLIAGAILLAILIIAIGMYIYNSSQSTITNAMTDMTTQEIDAFNNNFTAYEGEQTGSNVKALIGRLVANAKTYIDEPAKVPALIITDKVTVDNSKKNVPNTASQPNAAKATNDYIANLGKIRSAVELKHTYFVECEFNPSTGLVYKINITYGS